MATSPNKWGIEPACNAGGVIRRGRSLPFKKIMLIGEYRYRIGLKNRVAIPKKFRDALGERVMAMRGYEGSIMVVSRKNWSKLVEEAIGGPLTDPKVRDTARFLMGSAHEVEFDAQGRFVLPQSLVEHAGIAVGNEAIFVGLGRWVELWSSDRWDVRLKLVVHS